MKVLGPFQWMVGMSGKDHRGTVNPATGTGGPAGSVSVSHDVPFYKQRHVNECQDKCLHMVLDYHKKLGPLVAANAGTMPEKILTGKHRSPTEGLPDRQLRVLAGQAGMKVNYRAPDGGAGAEWDAPSLAAALQQGPIICSIRFRPKLFGSRQEFANGHAVVLTGVDENSVVFHDPWEGKNRKMPLEKFNNQLRPQPNMLQLVPDTKNTNTAEVPSGPGTVSGTGGNNLKKFRVQFKLDDVPGRSSSARAAGATEPSPQELIGPIEELANAGMFSRRDDSMVHWAACAARDKTLVTDIRTLFQRLSHVGTTNADEIREMRLTLYKDIRKGVHQGAPVAQMEQLFSRFRDQVTARQKEVSDLRQKLQKSCAELLSKHQAKPGEALYQMVAHISPESISDLLLKEAIDENGGTLAGAGSGPAIPVTTAPQVSHAGQFVEQSANILDTRGDVLRNS